MAARRLVALGHDVVLHGRNSDWARPAAFARLASSRVFSMLASSVSAISWDVFAFNAHAPYVLTSSNDLSG